MEVDLKYILFVAIGNLIKLDLLQKYELNTLKIWFWS